MLKKSRAVRVIESLMHLKGVPVVQLTALDGISLENIQAWLDGSKVALSPRSFLALHHYMGVGKEGLTPGTVHFWQASTRRGEPTAEARAAMLTVAPFLADTEIIEVQGPAVGRFRLRRAFALKKENVLVILIVASTFFPLRDPKVPEWIPGTSWKSGANGTLPVITVDQLYWTSLLQHALTPSEFNDIFSENFEECSWTDLRLMARERGFTPSDLAKIILTETGEDFVKLGFSDKTEIPALESASVTDPTLEPSSMPDLPSYHET